MDHYTIHVKREQDSDGGVFWVAWHPALDGCMAQGKTPEAAVESLTEARLMILRHLRAHALPIPAGDTNLKTCLIFVH
jgi:predicted RNase H-like HicB family nuclease